MGVNIGLSDAENPDRGYQLYLTALVMVLVAGMVVLGRLAARWAKKGYGYDDYAIIVSLVFSIVLTVMTNLAVVNGYGRHKASLTKLELTAALRYFYIAQVVYKIVIGFNKISILMLYLRIFTSKAFRISCYTSLAIVASFTFGSTIATILQCIPTKGSWDKRVDATCTNSTVFWYSFAVINILTDVMILCLPVREVLNLHLHRREKYGLLALFSLGAFVTVSSIIRATAVANSTHNMKDITWNFIPRGIWTLIEANTGIICASLPMLYKPAAVIFPCFGCDTTNTSQTFRSTSKTPGSGSYALGRRVNPFGLGKAPQRNAAGWRLPDGSIAPPASKREGYEGRDSTERMYAGGKRREEWESESDEHSSLRKERVPIRDLDVGKRGKGGRGTIMRQVDVDVDITYPGQMGGVQASDLRMQDAREAV